MATAYRVDRFSFVLWEGEPPSRVKQTTQELARPGIDDATIRTLGERGQASSSVLVSWHASWFAARQKLTEYLTLIGRDPVEVWWNSRQLSIDNRCKYAVESIDEVECRTNVRLIGSGLNLSGGVSLRTRWVLLPVSLDYLALAQ